jgi:hypothetical protein
MRSPVRLISILTVSFSTRARNICWSNTQSYNTLLFNGSKPAARSFFNMHDNGYADLCSLTHNCFRNKPQTFAWVKNPRKRKRPLRLILCYFTDYLFFFCIYTINPDDNTDSPHLTLPQTTLFLSTMTNFSHKRYSMNFARAQINVTFPGFWIASYGKNVPFYFLSLYFAVCKNWTPTLKKDLMYIQAGSSHHLFELYST